MADDATCRHADVESSGIAPDPGGQVHELGECVACGTRVHRVSPLHPWEPSDDRRVGGVDR